MLDPSNAAATPKIATKNTATPPRVLRIIPLFSLSFSPIIEATFIILFSMRSRSSESMWSSRSSSCNDCIMECAYRLYAVERKIDTKVRNIGQQKCYNDLRKRRRSLAWHTQRASRLKNFVLVSAPKTPAGRNYSGFGFQTASSVRNAAVRNITRFAGGTRSSVTLVDARPPSPQEPLCTARICR